MRALELRIGNLVLLNNPKYRPAETGKVHVIDDIRPKDAVVFELDKLPYSVCYGQFLEYIEPLPITTDWLIRFGFEFVNEVGGWCNKNHIVYQLDVGWEFHPFCTNDKHLQLKINYMHQLQNLEYVLRGEDFKFN